MIDVNLYRPQARISDHVSNMSLTIKATRSFGVYNNSGMKDVDAQNMAVDIQEAPTKDKTCLGAGAS